jgi:Zn-dependent oligopeptidase
VDASWPDFSIDLGPELEAAMAEHRLEVEAIAAGPWPPTFADPSPLTGRLRDELLAGGRVVDPAVAFRAITGREPAVRPMLALRGLV